MPSNNSATIPPPIWISQPSTPSLGESLTTYVQAGHSYTSPYTGHTWGPFYSNCYVTDTPEGLTDITDANAPAATTPVEPEVLYNESDGYQWNPTLPKGKKVPTPDSEQFYNKKIISLLPRLPKAEGLIGLEIECEGTKLADDTISFWSVHIDGSLRETDGHPPKEYTLKKPLDVPDVGKALKYLESKLKQAGSSVVQSQRTSVHVHVNVQDLTVRQLYCFVLLYLIFEEVLVEWVGPERAGNLFALRAKDSEYYVTMLEETLKKGSFRGWSNDYRYSACNICSVPKFGSVEFRAMEGTVDINRIMCWVELLVMLREKSLRYDNPVEIVEEFVQIGPLPFLRKVFNDPRFLSLVEHTPTLSGKLWDGLRLMRDVAYACEWLPPIKKKEGQESLEEESPWKVDPNYFPDFPWSHGAVVQTPQGLSSGRKYTNNNPQPYSMELKSPDSGLLEIYEIEQGETVWYYMSPHDSRRMFVYKGYVD